MCKSFMIKDFNEYKELNLFISDVTMFIFNNEFYSKSAFTTEKFGMLTIWAGPDFHSHYIIKGSDSDLENIVLPFIYSILSEDNENYAFMEDSYSLWDNFNNKFNCEKPLFIYFDTYDPIFLNFLEENQKFLYFYTKIYIQYYIIIRYIYNKYIS